MFNSMVNFYYSAGKITLWGRATTCEKNGLSSVFLKREGIEKRDTVSMRLCLYGVSQMMAYNRLNDCLSSMDWWDVVGEMRLAL